MTATPSFLPPARVARLASALPFWLSLALIPLIWISAVFGGWTILLVPLATWYLVALVDVFAGLDTDNIDPETPSDALRWYRLITLIWAPVQGATLLGLLAYAGATDHLSRFEEWALFAAFGIVTGAIGINYSHELMHQKPKVERWMADILLAMVMYSHFRTEHLLVHHRYIGTPKDPVTARYNEGFHRFFPRVLKQCLTSAFAAEKALLARKGKPWTDLSNPFWRYWVLQALFVALAITLAGAWGLFLLLTQAFIAIWHLELVNYMEHYGLTRKHLGDGKYEPTGPQHSWNAAHRVSNWLLINLQRHSDHHFKPDRRFPLLQNRDERESPQLPQGYPTMGILAMIPPLWRRRMNPEVREWRRRHYPEIRDWEPYNKATNPLPR